MVDVDSVVLSVQERDKWRHRLEVLERSLREVRDQRHRLETRLRRVKKEIAKLGTAADALMDLSRTRVSHGVNHATGNFPYR
jgi:septal ring factor EnvC (AmiA/AmiB activator)